MVGGRCPERVTGAVRHRRAQDILQGGRLTKEGNGKGAPALVGVVVTLAGKQMMTGGAQKVDPRVPSSHARQGSPSHWWMPPKRRCRPVEGHDLPRRRRHGRVGVFQFLAAGEAADGRGVHDPGHGAGHVGGLRAVVPVIDKFAWGRKCLPARPGVRAFLMIGARGLGGAARPRAIEFKSKMH